MPVNKPLNNTTMKKAIKIILVIAVLLWTANSLSAQVSFGVKGAFNMFNMTLKDNDDDKANTKMVPTFSAGVFAEIPIAPEFFIKPELLYAQKGYKNEDVDDAKTKLSYVELPVTFMYKGALSGGNVFLGFGPYFALGIGGKMKNGDSQTVKFKNDVSLIEAVQNPYYKPLDIGGKFYAGYEFGNGFSFAIETSLGLVNILPDIGGNESGDAKNVGFGLALGYKF